MTNIHAVWIKMLEDQAEAEAWEWYEAQPDGLLGWLEDQAEAEAWDWYEAQPDGLLGW